MLGPVIVAALALLALALLVLAKWISDLLLHGRRHVLTLTPQDYGLDYENVAFPSKDGLQLKGWWLPASLESAGSRGGSVPAVILLHPMFGNRQGLTARRRRWAPECPGSLDLLHVACGFHGAGYAVLLFDFRGHGESEAGICAGGYNEDQDVVGAVNYVFGRTAAAAPRVGVVGFGLGAMAALTAVGREKGDSRTIRVFSADNENSTGFTEYPAANIKKLRFIVAVDPASPHTQLRRYFRSVFPPLGRPVVALVDRFCRWRSGYPLDGALLIDAARYIYTPVLYVPACRDTRDGSDEAERIYEAIPGPREMWRIEERLEGLAVYEHVASHLERVLAFSNQQLGVVE